MESFGDRVRRLRIESGLSQNELAERVMVSQSNISAYEGNRQEPRKTQLILLAKTFGVSLDYMCGVSDTRSTSEPEH
nr:helix-turn-helix transcriptional regulator [uncultured Olsenella sp.]